MTSKPVTVGKLGSFKLRVSDAVYTISWNAVKKDGRVIDNNLAAIKVRK